MAKKAQEARSYPVPMDYFVQKLRSINGAGLNVTLKSENPTPNGVWFRIHHGVSFTSYGEKITVTLENLGNGTGVHILSECGMPTQVVDWGKNASNLQALFRYLEQGMPVGWQPAAAAQPVCAAPQAAPVQQPQAAVCPVCGAKVTPGAKFCGYCGARLV